MHRAFVLKKIAPAFWDGPSFAEVLRDAALGFPSSSKLCHAGQVAPVAYQELQAQQDETKKTQTTNKTPMLINPDSTIRAVWDLSLFASIVFSGSRPGKY